MSETEKAHIALAVQTVDGMPFVTCSCAPNGVRPQSSVWLQEHWQGDQDSGVVALNNVVFGQSEEHPCGHSDTVPDCGGCDPGAMEFVITDEGVRRPFDPTLDMRTPPGSSGSGDAR